jgi:hypothetical protein
MDGAIARSKQTQYRPKPLSNQDSFSITGLELERRWFLKNRALSFRAHTNNGQLTV